MPKNFGQPFVRLTAFGTLYGVETWAFNLSVASTDVPTQAVVDAVGPAFQTFHTSTGFISSQCKLVGVKAALIGADGLYGANEAVEWVAGTVGGIAGAASTANPLPQAALAVTLEGARPRGAAGRGRFYVPAPGQVIGADGRLSQAQANTAASYALTLVNAVNAAMPGDVSIVGPATATGRAPARQRVVAVRVGRIIDTIRSRRSSMPEDYVFAASGVSGPFESSEGFGGGGGDF